MNPFAAAKQETITASVTSWPPSGPPANPAASAATVSVPAKPANGSAFR